MALFDVAMGNANAEDLAKLGNEENVNLVLDEWTALHYLCHNGNVTKRAIQILLNLGANPNAVDENHFTPLHALCGNKRCVELSDCVEVLAAVADCTVLEKSEEKSAIFELCGNPVVSKIALETLLSKMDKVTVDVNGNSVLHVLCAKNDNVDELVDMLQLVLKHHGDFNVLNKYQSTPLHELCENELVNEALIELAVQHKGNFNIPNNIGATPLHHLAGNEDIALNMIEYVLKAGGNFVFPNSFGKRPVDYVLERGDQNSILFAKKYIPLTKTSTDSTSRVVGGESTVSLVGKLKDLVVAWNKSLPPFDNEFYNALCCDPSLVDEYELVQNISLQLYQDMDNVELESKWKAQMDQWRNTVLVAFAALIVPKRWNDYTSIYGRNVPNTLQDKQKEIQIIWDNNPENTTTRLQKTQKIL